MRLHRIKVRTLMIGITQNLKLSRQVPTKNQRRNLLGPITIIRSQVSPGTVMGLVSRSPTVKPITRLGASICLCSASGPSSGGIWTRKNRPLRLRFQIVWLRWRSIPLILWFWRVALWTVKSICGTFQKTSPKSLSAKLTSTSTERPSLNWSGCAARTSWLCRYVFRSYRHPLTAKYWYGAMQTSCGTRLKVTSSTRRRAMKAQWSEVPLSTRCIRWRTTPTWSALRAVLSSSVA